MNLSESCHRVSAAPGSTAHFNKQRQHFHQAGASESCCLQSCQNETHLNWLKNQVKVVGEREILASLVEFKHHSMAETIQNEKEEKKTKAEAPGLTKKDKKHQTSNLHISVTAASAELKILQESDLDQIYTLLKNQRRQGSRFEV